jgi:hypothetical protein
VVGSTEVAIKIILTPGPSFKSRCPLDLSSKYIFQEEKY